MEATYITIKGKKCTISGHLHQGVYDVSRKLIGFKKWNERERALYFDPSTHNIELVCNSLPNLVLCSETQSRVSRIQDLKKEEAEILAAKESGLPDESFSFRFKTKPYDHQLKAFSISRDKKYFALLMEMGTGKTKVAIDTAAYLYSQGKIDTLIVIAPNGVHRQWVDEDVDPETGEPLGEVKKHIPDWIEYEMAAYKSGMTKKLKKKFDEIYAITDYSKLRIISINIESLSHNSGLDFLKHALSISKSLLVIDESSRIKNVSSNRTQNILRISEMAEYRRIMSGSPVTQGLEDLYSQFKFLSWEILGMNTYTSFKSRYCDELTQMNNQSGKQYKTIVGYRNEDELKKKIDSWSFQARKEDCLDLPPIVYEKRYVELAPEQKKRYEQIINNYIICFESEAIVDASLAISRLLYLQRIICGHIKDDQGVVHRIPEKGAIPRVEVCMSAIEEAISESDGKIIVWCRFQNDYAEIAEALNKRKIKFVSYLGKDKDASLYSFKTDKDVKVMISNPKSGGIGLNITEANTMIYYSNSFEAEARWQSIARTHRSGQTRKVTCIDLVSKNTIDGKILQALQSKQNIADVIVENPSKFIK